MTQAQKLALRLSEFPNRAVRLTVFIDPSGAMTGWVIDGDKKIEGANGKALNPPPQYDDELQFIKKDNENG